VQIIGFKNETKSRLPKNLMFESLHFSQTARCFNDDEWM